MLELGEGDPAYNPDDNTVTFAPVGGLRAGTGYQVFVASVLGGPLQQSDYSWAFSTLVPTVVSTTPAADAAINSGPQRIQVVFSSAVDGDLRGAPAPSPGTSSPWKRSPYLRPNPRPDPDPDPPCLIREARSMGRLGPERRSATERQSDP